MPQIIDRPRLYRRGLLVAAVVGAPTRNGAIEGGNTLDSETTFRERVPAATSRSRRTTESMLSLVRDQEVAAGSFKIDSKWGEIGSGLLYADK